MLILLKTQKYVRLLWSYVISFIFSSLKNWFFFWFFFLTMVNKQKALETKIGTKCYQCSVAVVIFGYQDTEHSVVWVCHAVFLTFLCSCTHMSQCVCVWVCARDGGLDLRSMTHIHHRLVQDPPLQWVLEWHNLHHCPLISLCAGAFVMCQYAHSKSIITKWKQPGAHSHRLFSFALQFLWLQCKGEQSFPLSLCPLFFIYLSLEAPATRTVSQIKQS